MITVTACRGRSIRRDSLIAQQEDQTHVAYHVAYEAHWKNYDKGDYYYSFDVGAYVSIVDVDDVDQEMDSYDRTYSRYVFYFHYSPLPRRERVGVSNSPIVL